MQTATHKYIPALLIYLAVMLLLDSFGLSYFEALWIAAVFIGTIIYFRLPKAEDDNDVL